MTLPLLILAVFSVVAGYDFWHTKLLDAGWRPESRPRARSITTSTPRSSWRSPSRPASGGCSSAAVVFGSGDPAKVARWKWRPFRALEPACAAKFGFDELYRELILRPVYLIAQFFAFTDREGVDGAVNGIGRAATTTSVRLGRRRPRRRRRPRARHGRGRPRGRRRRLAPPFRPPAHLPRRGRRAHRGRAPRRRGALEFHPLIRSRPQRKRRPSPHELAHPLPDGVPAARRGDPLPARAEGVVGPGVPVDQPPRLRRDLPRDARRLAGLLEPRRHDRRRLLARRGRRVDPGVRHPLPPRRRRRSASRSSC